MGFSRQGHWSGLSFPSPGTRHPNQDIKQVKQVPSPQKFLLCHLQEHLPRFWPRQRLSFYFCFFAFIITYQFISVNSVVSDSLRLHNCRTLDLPVHHQLPELTQTHVHRVGAAIQPSHPLLSPCPPTFNLSQPQSLFQRVSSFSSCGQSIAVSASASVLPMNIQDRTPLGWISWISLQSKGLLRVFSNTTVQKHQFLSVQLSLQSNSHIPTWLLEKP